MVIPSFLKIIAHDHHDLSSDILQGIIQRTGGNPRDHHDLSSDILQGIIQRTGGNPYWNVL